MPEKCNVANVLIDNAKELLKDNPDFYDLSLAVELIDCAFRIERKIKKIAEDKLWKEKSPTQGLGFGSSVGD